MVICIYVNSTIDKTIYLERFEYGGTNRPYKVQVDGAGKAINAAVVLKALGTQSAVVGVAYDADSKIITGRLDSYGINHNLRELQGTSRTNTKIFDKEKQVITELNESGQTVPQSVLDEISAKACEMAKEGDVVILTGSLPPGCGADYYAGIIRALKQKNVKCVLDADGETLRLGVAEKPYLIKPNTDELAAITGSKASDVDEVVAACGKLLAEGIEVVAVSMGGDGAVICGREGAYFAKPLRVDVQSTVGAGDSMVAGMVANIGKPVDEMLRAGVAAATASITLSGTQLTDKPLFEKYYELVTTEEI